MTRGLLVHMQPHNVSDPKDPDLMSVLCVWHELKDIITGDNMTMHNLVSQLLEIYYLQAVQWFVS